MVVDVLTPDDPRVKHHFLDVDDGITYHYMLAKPQVEPASTVLLLHGWPDLGMGWRFQVPYLLSLGMQVIVPDMLGYGKTSAPEPAAVYSLKNISAHMAHVIRAVTDEPVILGGHDWGALLAWRLAMYHPSLFRGIFCFSIPYFPPQPSVPSLEDAVAQNPFLQYQLQNASSEAENLATKSPAHLRGFLNAMYGGVTPDGLPGFDPRVGLIQDRLPHISPSPLVPPEIMEYFVTEFSRTGLHGPMNWYRTRSINGRDELPFATDATPFRFQVPAMLVMAGQDPLLPPNLANGQEQYFSAGLKKEVIPEASHWILIHSPEKANRYIGEFIKQILGN